MATFKIEGGKQLHGDLYPQGAKNEALQVICAVLLTPEKIQITNIPEISDVIKLIKILGDLGVKTERVAKGNYIFQADEIHLDYLKTENFARHASSLRGSIMILGPLLARFGIGYIPQQGGDKNRPTTPGHPFYRSPETWRYLHLQSQRTFFQCGSHKT